MPGTVIEADEIGTQPPPGGRVERPIGEPPRLAPPRPWLHAWPRVAFWGLALLALAWAFVSLWWPVGFDLGLYAWVAGVIRDGGMQYRDAWDMHGPLVGYLVALPALIVGQQPAGIRVLDLAFLAAGCWGLAHIVAPIAGREAGRWGSVLLVLVYGSFTFNETAQPDGWVALASLAAFAPVLASAAQARRPGIAALVVAGIAAGCFALIKPFYGLFVLVPLVAAWAVSARAAHADRSRTSIMGLVTPTLILAATSMAVVAAAAAWFAAHGALDELIDVHLRYTSRVYGGTRSLAIGPRVTAIVEFFREGKVIAVALPLMLVGGAALRRDARRSLLAAALVWIVVGVFCAALQNKYYYYHWVPTYPPLVVLATIGAALLLREPRRSLSRVVAIAAVGVVAAHAALRPAAYVAHWALYATGIESERDYYARFEAPPVYPVHQRQAARYLAAETAPTEGFAVWGYDAGLLYLTDRPTPFRLAGWFWPMVTGTPEVQAEYRAEYLDALTRTRPPFLVVNSELDRVTSKAELENFPALRDLVAREFVRDTAFGPLVVMRRRAP